MRAHTLLVHISISQRSTIKEYTENRRQGIAFILAEYGADMKAETFAVH